MPTAEEIFAKLAGDRYFPTFALIKGYWQVPVYEEDRDLTTCVCHRGLFRFRAMQKARLYNQDNNTRNAIKTSEQRQKEAAARHGHSRRRCVNDVRPTNSLRCTVLNSTATHVNGSTSASSPTTPTHTVVHTGSRPYTPSDSQSDNFVNDYWVTFIHPLSSAS